MLSTLCIRDANDFELKLAFGPDEMARLQLRVILDKIEEEHPDHPSCERQRLIFRGQALREPGLKLSQLFSDSSEIYRLYLIVSRERDDTSSGTNSGVTSSEESAAVPVPIPRAGEGSADGSVFLRLDERSEQAALQFIVNSPGRSPGSDVSATELMASLAHIRRRRGSSLGSYSDVGTEIVSNAGVETSPEAETPEQVAGGPDPEGVVQDGAANGERDGGDAEEEGRQPIRWLNMSVLLRLAIGFVLLSQGSRGSECFFFLGCGVIYYLIETGIAKEIMARYYNNNNNAAAANGQARVAGAGEGGGSSSSNIAQPGNGNPPNRWYSLYQEGFPVPQRPGIVLDAFSVVMAFCASLKPGWDPRPVNPNFFRDVFDAAPVAAAPVAAADGAAGQE